MLIKIKIPPGYNALYPGDFYMRSSEYVFRLAEFLRLTPYQTYVLEVNCKKYDLRRLVKRGGVLYAPYLCDDRHKISEYIARLILGPRADLIGTNRMIVKDRRGIRVYATGFHSIRNKGIKQYADPMGNRIARNMFVRRA